MLFTSLKFQPNSPLKHSWICDSLNCKEMDLCTLIGSMWHLQKFGFKNIWYKFKNMFHFWLHKTWNLNFTWNISERDINLHEHLLRTEWSFCCLSINRHNPLRVKWSKAEKKGHNNSDWMSLCEGNKGKNICV